MSRIAVAVGRACSNPVVRSPSYRASSRSSCFSACAQRFFLRREVLLLVPSSRSSSLFTMSEKRRLETSKEAAEAASELPFPNGQPEDDCVSEPASKKEKHSGARKKFAFLLSYDGREYFGMQRNPGWKTIEEEFLYAMLKAGYIDEDSYKTPQNAWFQRAARTDKGVSAVRQVVSLRMVPDENAVENLNGILPPAIRVMGMRRVTRGFNPKTKCNARSYAYLMPSFALCRVEDGPITESSRPSRESVEQFDLLLKRFIGTKKFHNFTARRDMDCPSNSRYIMDFDCGEPFEKDGMEWVLVKIKGASFMLHQIRKMIGLCIAVMQGFASEAVFEEVFRPGRVDVPIAPGLGLMLEKVHYDYYDEKYGADGFHDKLDWEKENEVVEEFRDRVIFSSIFRTEKEEKSMLNWLSTLPLHTYGERGDGAPSAADQSAVRTGIGKAMVSLYLANEHGNGGSASTRTETTDIACVHQNGPCGPEEGSANRLS